MPLQATSGAASYDAFGGGVPVVPTYIEEVFSTYLYEGNGTTQQIVNGIDLSTKGGLVWTKSRSNAFSHMLIDTVRTSRYLLNSNTTGAQADQGSTIANFNTDGYTFTSSGNSWNTNNYTNNLYVGWTFRKQPKFFDIVTYTGDDSTNRTISHNLGSTPACIIIKAVDSAAAWYVYHRSLTADYLMRLNTTAAQTADASYKVNNVTSTTFRLQGGGSGINGSGVNFIAYLFAHNAGGFGLTGTDNVISCGSFTTDGSGNATVNLGYEPQWFLEKNSSSAGDNWNLMDTMRGMSLTSVKYLFPNASSAEASIGVGTGIPTATGLDIRSHSANTTYIYIAIRRGPMKVPTTGTSVYNAIVRNGTAANATVTGVGFPVDLIYTSLRPSGTHNPVLSDRLRGVQRTLGSRGTQAEQTELTALTSFASMDGVSFGGNTEDFWNGFNSQSGSSYVNWFFRRAPSFMDVVCYTGTGSARTLSHNLAAVPQLMIIKCRNDAQPWAVYSSPTGITKFLVLNQNYQDQLDYGTFWNNTTPTASVFSLGNDPSVNGTGSKTYVAYLFATCAGVSKVFNYTGNGSSQTINCGFTGGARFVLIKRTDSDGNWYVWDTARGIVSGNDPHLNLNDTAAEVTSDDTIDTDSTGFVVNQVSATDVNVSSATYIGLAIA